MTLPTITTNHALGAVAWSAETPDGSRVRLRSPYPDSRSWYLVVSMPRRGWTQIGLTPDAVAASWIARITPADNVPADVVALVERITTEARLWAKETP
jgi:hypothetical protein